LRPDDRDLATAADRGCEPDHRSALFRCAGRRLSSPPPFATVHRCPMADSYHPTGLAAYRPAEIARRIDEAGVQKARLALLPLTALGMLPGAFIGFGALFFLVTMTGAADAGFGPSRLLGGAAFSLGLILVVVGGAELFT